ncbi:MAG: Ig-like domain-containing protein [Euryarchaeota archaeon]|nr:Ig-like domain-containing protein [Euryarchaeota archaeon]
MILSLAPTPFGAMAKGDSSPQASSQPSTSRGKAVDDPLWPQAAPGPSVLSSLPSNCTANWPVWTNLSVGFTTAMNAPATLGAFSVSPSVPGAHESVTGSYLNWTLTGPLSYGTTYVLTLTRAAQGASGTPLSAPWQASFSTELSNVYATPQPSGLCPVAGSTNVPLGANVTVSFDVVMDAASLPGNFSIYPPVAGGLGGAGGLTFHWVHTHPFLPNTTYLANISTGVESAQGVHLAGPLNFSFTTGPAPPKSPPPCSSCNTTKGNSSSYVRGALLLVGGAAVVVATSFGTWFFLRRRRHATGSPVTIEGTRDTSRWGPRPEPKDGEKGEEKEQEKGEEEDAPRSEEEQGEVEGGHTPVRSRKS